jgi:hypothetical protein
MRTITTLPPFEAAAGCARDAGLDVSPAGSTAFNAQAHRSLEVEAQLPSSALAFSGTGPGAVKWKDGRAR